MVLIVCTCRCGLGVSVELLSEPRELHSFPECPHGGQGCDLREAKGIEVSWTSGVLATGGGQGESYNSL